MNFEPKIKKIRQDIIEHPLNAWAAAKGWEPVFQASTKSKIIIAGQAPGIQAQKTQISWNDQSGKNLRAWLGVTDQQFYNPENFALLAMDFYFPGPGKGGDLPPRKEFAKLWHPKLRAVMPEVKLTILLGQYSQAYYLRSRLKKNLTATVRDYQEYLPEYIVLPHPSPRNIRWQIKNPWFIKEVVPVLQNKVSEILG